MKFIKLPLSVIQNILAQSILLTSVIMVSLLGYISSYLVHRDKTIWLMYNWFNTTRKIMYFILGVRIEYRGVENIPQNEVFIFASKHQSSIETSFFFNKFALKTVYAFKKELHRVPTWKRLSAQFGGIIIDRQKGKYIMDYFATQAKEYLDAGYCLAIFPEGTRVPVGKYVRFKYGIAKIYAQNNKKVVPVALNTGLIISKRSWFIYSGKIIIEFLPPINPGMSEEEFLPYLEKIINTKSNELVAEAKGLKK